MLTSHQETPSSFNNEGLLEGQPGEIQWVLAENCGRGCILELPVYRLQWVLACGRFRTLWNTLGEVETDPPVSTHQALHRTACFRCLPMAVQNPLEYAV